MTAKAKESGAPAPLFTTREGWLEAATDALVETFSHQLAEVFPDAPSFKTSVSCGFPRNDRNGKVIGQCWPSGSTEAGTRHMFITPRLADPIEVLATLLHEMIHAYDNCEHQHKGPFQRAMKAVGLTGKPTATVAGPELVTVLSQIAEELGEYPHDKLTPMPKLNKQSARMLKVVCAADKNPSDYLIRMTQKWLDLYGAPICPCHNERMLTEAEWLDRTARRLAAATKRREAKVTMKEKGSK